MQVWWTWLVSAFKLDVLLFFIRVIGGGAIRYPAFVSRLSELEELTCWDVVKVLPEAGNSVEGMGYVVGEVVGFESVT